MGNNNSVCPLSIHEKSIECPICLEKHSEYITLNCGHKFDIYCIQMYLHLKYINNELFNCPYCRTNISNSILNQLWKYWIIIKYNFNLFSNNIILDLNYDIVRFIKFNKVDCVTDININQILIPIINGKPSFILSPTINDSNVSYNDRVVELSHLLSKYNTYYGEKIDIYNFIMDCYITDGKWSKFLSKINKKFYNIRNNIDYNIKYNYSGYKIRFYISDINKVKTIDNYNGFYDNKLHYFKNRKFKCIFKMYFVKNDYNLYLINELKAIVY
jgi:hypothetical protein